MMLGRLVVTALIAVSAGCAAPPLAGEPEDVAPRHSSDCDASKAQALIGQSGSSELAAKAQQWSGAGAVRWLKPGQLVTMEYRADRLNIELDGEGRVVAIRCG